MSTEVTYPGVYVSAPPGDRIGRTMPGTIEFPTSTDRNDPYRTFRFRLKWDNIYVAGISRVSALTRVTEVVTHCAGGDPALPRRFPGQTEYAAVTLERGVTHDRAFEQWAKTVWDYHRSTIANGDQDASLKDFRKDIILELYNEAGQKILAYNIYRCWPSEFVALPALDADTNTVAIERLTLQNEGWDAIRP